jgi:hypothetical protein
MEETDDETVVLAIMSAGLAKAQQSSGWLEFKAPFAFNLEAQKLPAGEYRILIQDGWLQLQSRKGGENAHVLTMPMRQKNVPQTNRTSRSCVPCICGPILPGRSLGNRQRNGTAGAGVQGEASTC